MANGLLLVWVHWEIYQTEIGFHWPLEHVLEGIDTVLHMGLSCSTAGACCPSLLALLYLSEDFQQNK